MEGIASSFEWFGTAENNIKRVSIAVLCVLLSSSYVTATQPKKGDQPVEEVFTLASVQFATHLELMHMMLTGD